MNNNTVFLEFYGLPGSGKSTISHLVAEELRKQGKKVIEPTYDTDHRCSPSVRKGIKLLKLIRYALFSPKKYKSLKKLIKENGYTGSDVISQAANIAPKLWEYDHPSADIVVYDEGLTQSAIALAKNDMVCVDNENKLYELIGDRIARKFYITIDEKTALERMASRKRHDSRIEKMDARERLDALGVISECCKRLYNMGNSVKVDAMQPVMEAVQATIKAI